MRCQNQIKTYWLSFADEDDTGLGGGFLGVVIVDALTPRHAHEAVTFAGLNPGGEVLINDMTLMAHLIEKKYRNILLDRETAMALDKSLMEKLKQ